VSLDPQLSEQLREIIKVASATVADVAGDYGYGAPQSRFARVVRIAGEADGPQGTTETSNTVLIVEAEIFETDLIFLPGVDSSSEANGRFSKRIERGVGELGTVDFFRVTI
tara:strand:+ start:352 stop:684 length:333 start_codon:yes stop_codon:yes gene_type:complete